MIRLSPRLALAALCLLCWAAPLLALEQDGAGRVAAVPAGDMVALEDGAQVRLVGIRAPGRAQPLAEAARTALSDMLLGRTVALSYGGTRTDRHGRRLAHLHLAEGDGAGLWAQGEMLRRGLARVDTAADNRALAGAMLTLEREARAARRGIWAHGDYDVLRPEAAGRHLDSFQLVEGRILRVATVGRRVYLNFGADWRTDFTVALPPEAVRLFRRTALDPAALEGQRVRVRGWLMLRNGPLIEATHPEQIELLPP